MEGKLGPEPLEHSVLDVDLDGRPMEGILVSELLEHSVLDVDLDTRPMESMLVLEPLEHSVLDVTSERGSGVGLSALEPLEHSVLEVASDIRPKRVRTVLEPLEHSVPDLAPIESAYPFVRTVVSDLTSTEDVGQKLVPLEPLEHSVPEGPQSWGNGLVYDFDSRVESRSACLPRVSSDAQGVDVTLLNNRSEADRSRTEPGEAIVVGAVGSPAPWFLTGWAHDVEVEFMIDTGCRVTILATTMFEHMCTVDPRVRSKLRPCRRRSLG